MFHVVLKPFDGGGAQRLPGEAIDPDLWRNGRRLISQRYLSPGPVAAAPVTCACGRLWVGEAREHACVAPRAKKVSA